MATYIERETADKALSLSAANDKDKNRRTWAKAICVLHDLPAADVAPVVHGKWAPSEENPGFLVCSVCGDCYVYDEWVDGRKWRYCPNCGAKMDGKGEDA